MTQNTDNMANKLPPLKLTFDNNKVRLKIQTEEDLIDTKKLNDEINSILKDKTSEGYMDAKKKSEEIKAESNRRFNAANVLEVSFGNNPSNMPTIVISCHRNDINNIKSIIDFTHSLFEPNYSYIEGVATHIFQINEEGFNEIVSLK